MLNGRYKVLAEIGAGSAGVVYKVQYLPDGALRAVKRYRPGLTAKKLAAFFLPEAAAPSAENSEDYPLGALQQSLADEYRHGGFLRHPNLLELIDFDTEENGAYFLVSEFLQGCTLAEYIGQNGALQGRERIVDCAVQVLRGLEFLHAKGLIHRDIKPSNIFLCADGSLKILDYGLVSQEQDAAHCSPAGTPGYTAPEVLRGAGGASSDLFGLGATLYELITGRRLFTDNADILTWELPNERLSMGTVGSFTELLESLLEPDPAVRSRSAADALAFIARSQSVAAESEDTLRTYILGAKMLGREAEFSALKQAYAALQNKRGGMLLISGESGIGKTRLAAEFARYVKLLGGKVFESRFEEYGGDRLAPLRRIVRDVLAFSPPHLSDSFRAELCFLLPELRERFGDTYRINSGGKGNVRVICNALLTFIESVAAYMNRPFVLLFEDLHFQSEIALWEVVQARAARSNILILASARDDEVSEQVVELFGKRTIRLSSFGGDFYRAMAAEIFHILPGVERFLANLERYTSGNPFFIEQLLLELAARGVLRKAGDKWEILHCDLESIRITQVEEILERRLRKLSAAETECMQYIAACPAGIQARRLARLMENARLSKAIESLKRACLLVEVDGKVRSCHHRIRVFFYAKIPAPAILHGQLGDLFHDTDTDDIYETAFHYERSANDSRKRTYLRKAAERAAAESDFPLALRYYVTLLQHLEKHATPTEEVIAVILEKSCVAIKAGEWTDNEQDLIKALHFIEQGQAIERKGDVYFQMASANTAFARYKDATHYVQLALSEYEHSGNETGYVQCLTILAQLEDMHGAYSAALGYYREIAEICRRHDNQAQLASVLHLAGMSLLQMGDLSAALQSAEESISIARRIDNKFLTAKALANKGNILFRLREYPQALECQHKALELNRTIGDNTSFLSIQHSIGWIYFRQGNFPKALEYFQTGIIGAEAQGDRHTEAAFAFSLACLYTEASEPNTALHWGEKTIELYRKLGIKGGLFGGYDVLGLINMYRGNDRDAFRYLAKLLRLGRELGPFYTGYACGRMAKLFRNIGNYHRSEYCFRKSLELHTGLAMTVEIAERSIELAECLHAQRKHAEALRYADKGIAAAEQAANADIALRGKTLRELIAADAMQGDIPAMVQAALLRLEALIEHIPDRRGAEYVWYALWKLAALPGATTQTVERYRRKALRMYIRESKINGEPAIRRRIAELKDGGDSDTIGGCVR